MLCDFSEPQGQARSSQKAAQQNGRTSELPLRSYVVRSKFLDSPGFCHFIRKPGPMTPSPQSKPKAAGTRPELCEHPNNAGPSSFPASELKGPLHALPCCTGDKPSSHVWRTGAITCPRPLSSKRCAGVALRDVSREWDWTRPCCPFPPQPSLSQGTIHL